jgi:2-polyprenyl-6-methoxyphenol hydroxylase-like FAD-dependent oxidoreductase
MKAVICGAGIAGLTLAHQLAAQGWEVTLLEQASGPRTRAT